MTVPGWNKSVFARMYLTKASGPAIILKPFHQVAPQKNRDTKWLYPTLGRLCLRHATRGTLSRLRQSHTRAYFFSAPLAWLAPPQLWVLSSKYGVADQPSYVQGTMEPIG